MPTFETVVFFHTGPPGGTAIQGFLHPLMGLDHLLAMVTVGMLSAQMGGRAIWTVPSTFVLVMALGGVLGFQGVPVPFVERGIAASVVVLGLAVLAQRSVPELVAMVVVALFATFHGHAHGVELGVVASALDATAYVLGFMVATAGLHVIGALIGYIALRSPAGAWRLRGGGAVIAAVGVYLLVTA
jgi:urease accessory protein